MPTVHYLPDNRQIETDQGRSILGTSLANEIPHIHVCGGNARCSTCRVMVLEGVEHLPSRNEKETLMAEKLKFPPNIRLSCQTPVQGNLKVRRLVLDDEDIAITKQPVGTIREEPVGVEKPVAIMFADIRNFTEFSENHVPYDVIHLLNRYYYRIGKVIQAHGGQIDNYIGDGIMALFPESEAQDAAYRAVKAGLGMLQAVEQMRPYVRDLHDWELKIGIGIHYGLVVVGNVGANEHQYETAIGDAVNLASRIEGQNKALGAEMLISDAVLERLKKAYTLKQTCNVTIKGKTGDYALHEIASLE